jgi:hypothetical protein
MILPGAKMMINRVRLPTGEILSPLSILDGEPEWNDAVSLVAQVIPTCMTLRWTTSLSMPLVEIDKQLRLLGCDGIRDTLMSLAPLVRSSAGSEFTTFARDAAQLVVSLTRSTRSMLQKGAVGVRTSRSALLRFNHRIEAFGVVARLVEAATPLWSRAGIEWPAPPLLSPSANRSEMLTCIETVALYEEATTLLLDALP